MNTREGEGEGEGTYLHEQCNHCESIQFPCEHNDGEDSDNLRREVLSIIPSLIN